MAYRRGVVHLVVNGSEHTVDAPSGRSLLTVLRDDLGLTGAKYGCGEGRCGACTVLLDGEPVRACVVDVDAVDGRAVTTVEGLPAERDGLHPVQRAIVEERALQCGYCTPGMVMAAAALLARDPVPDDAAIRAALAGNICRCGGYPRILRAVRAAAVPTDPGLPAARDTAAAVAGDVATWTLLLPATPADERGGRDWGWSTPGGARLVIGGDGRVTAFTGKVNGGQGNRAALARLVAAELAVPPAAVRLEMGDTASAPYDLGTFGSRSIVDAGHGLRLLARAGREALLAEAARRWGLDADDLRAAGGVVCHPPSGGEIGYGALVAGDPRTITVDPDAPLDPVPAGLTDVDAPVRDDLVAAATGRKRFPSDLTAPGMLHGRVLRPPAYGASLRTVDTSGAGAMPGVTVVEDGDFVAVAAPTRAAATAALDAVRAEWHVPPRPAEADLPEYLRTHPARAHGWGGAQDVDTGDVDAALATAEVRLDATYTTAYIAHVPLEPRVALARLDGDHATVWLGTQRPFAVRWAVAAALGLPEDRVRVVVPDFGGGFGGKHTPDVAVEAARLARAAGRPVRVAWTREEEFRWGYFRPAAVIDVRSGATRDGTLTAWEFTNINSGPFGLASPYEAANQRLRFRPAESPVPQGSYRALAATANHFARESHVDELASALGVDPLDLRLRHLRDERLKDVLAAVAERYGWRRRVAGNARGVGLACGVEKDARVATIAEVAVDPDGTPRVLRIVTAVDCGAVVDPDGLRGQVVGATIMGLGGALFEAVHVDRGRVRNATLGDYRVPRFPDVPPIEVVVLDRPDIPSAGAGETPIIAVAPALANAIHAATGRRIRSLPLAPDGTIR